MAESRVIDSNSFDHARIGRFLQASAHNCIVIPDLVLMEAFRGRPLANIAPLAVHAEQVLILKPVGHLLRQHGQLRGLRKRLVNHRLTSLLPRLCERAQAAEAGDPDASAFLKRFSDWSNDISQSTATYEAIRASMREMAAEFSDDDVRRYRSGATVSEAFAVTLRDQILQSVVLTAQKERLTGSLKKGPVLYSYLFRFYFMLEVWLLDRIWNGSKFEEKVATIRNDMVDASVAASASLFDGLWTNDSKMKGRFDTAVRMLSLMDRLSRTGGINAT